MQDLLTVLPMAFVMIAGPQIVTAIVLATSAGARRDSAYFLLGVAAATTLGVTVAYHLTGFLKTGLLRKGGGSRLEHAVDVAIIAVLLLLAWNVFRHRKHADPPRWMARLQAATPLFAFMMGFLMFALLPGDLLGMFAVGAHLAHRGEAWWNALLFVGLTVFLAGVPLLLRVTLGSKAGELLPEVRDWMTKNSWIVSEVVIGFFLLACLKHLLRG